VDTGIDSADLVDGADEIDRIVMEWELTEFIAYLLMTFKGWPTGLDVEFFCDRAYWPEHPIMRGVAEIIDNS
jgi:hypothetical protein